MKILVVGSTGLLGSAILSCSEHDIVGTYLEHAPWKKGSVKLDITDREQVFKTVQRVCPDSIIHCAALIDTETCEEKPDVAKKLHVDGTKNLVDAAKDNRAHFVYMSTEVVFDGKKGNYTEHDVPNPLNVYARTKLEGERCALEYSNSCSVRTNLFGWNYLHKESVAEWMLHALRNRKEITLFDDVYFTPILTTDLASILMQMVKRRFRGLYHVGGAQRISKYGFGLELAKVFGLEPSMFKPIHVREKNFKGERPLDTSLDCSKIQEELGLVLPNITQGLERFKNTEGKHKWKA